MPLQPFIRFVTDQHGDMIERGLILFAIVVSAIDLWYALGAQVASKLIDIGGAPWLKGRAHHPWQCRSHLAVGTPSAVSRITPSAAHLLFAFASTLPAPPPPSRHLHLLCRRSLDCSAPAVLATSAQ